MPQPTDVPICIVDGCENDASLTATAIGHFYSFTTFYCAGCYEKLAEGRNLRIDPSRITVRRNEDNGPIPVRPIGDRAVTG